MITKIIPVKVKTFSAAAALGFFLCSSPNAEIIDFDHLTGYGHTWYGKSHTEDGFFLEATTSYGGYIGNYGWYPRIHYTGTTSLFDNGIDSVSRITREDGGLFDLISIDLDTLSCVCPKTATFIGTKEDNSTTTQSFTTSDGIVGSLQTFYFGPEFSELKKVEWAQVDGG